MRYWNQQIEQMSRRDLDALILKKLRNTVRYAYTYSPYYHLLLHQKGIKPDDIKKLEDMSNIPITTKEDLIANQKPKAKDFYFLSAPASQRWSRHYTSGSQGDSKACFRSYDDWDVSREKVLRAYVAAGLKKGDMLLNFLPMGINISGLASSLALYQFYDSDTQTLKRLGIEVITAGLNPVPSRTELLTYHEPSALFGAASTIDRFARELELNGARPENGTVEKILLVGEPSTEKKRKRIADAFDAEVFDEYASNEGDMMACECRDHSGLHVWEDHILLNAVDPETYEPLGEGEEGMDITTTLVDDEKFSGMVLLNYHHGDKFSLITKEKCSCGRTSKRISHPTRFGYVVDVGYAKLDPSDVEALLYGSEVSKHLNGEYGILKTEDEVERLYPLKIIVEAKGNSSESPPGLEQKLKNQLLKANIGLAVATGPGGIATLEYIVFNEGELKPFLGQGKPGRIIDISKCPELIQKLNQHGAKL